MYVVRIFDTQKREYWKTPKGKGKWASVGFAKSAFKCHSPGIKGLPEECRSRYGREVRYDDQDRFVLHVEQYEIKDVWIE